MVGGKRRLRRLEAQIKRAISDQASQPLRSEPAWTAKHPTGRMTAVPSAPMPAELVDAARAARHGDLPVRLELPYATVVAVIGGAGYPQEWWTAIWWAAEPRTDRHPVVGLQHLPIGLSALAVTWVGGELSLLVSDSAEPARQHAAAMTALAASEPLSRRAGSPIGRRLAPSRAGGAASVSQARAVTAVAAVILLTASLAFAISLARHRTQPPSVAAQRPAPASSASRPAGSQTPRHGDRASSPARHRPKARPTPTPTPRATTPAGPGPSQPPSSPPGAPPRRGRTSPAPSPSPSPTPSPSHSRKCVSILGIHVCV